MPNGLHSSRQPQIVLVKNAAVVGRSQFNPQVGFRLPWREVLADCEADRQAPLVLPDDGRRGVVRAAVDREISKFSVGSLASEFRVAPIHLAPSWIGMTTLSNGCCDTGT